MSTFTQSSVSESSTSELALCENVQVVKADYSNPSHQRAILLLMDAYALAPAGGGKKLTPDVTTRLIQQLALRPFAHSFIAFIDDNPVGLINVFETFSTFKAASVVNLHDVVVLDGYRGHGIAQSILSQVEAFALSLGACKLTLEVLASNTQAQGAYRKYGFVGETAPFNNESDPVLFWQKVF